MGQRERTGAIDKAKLASDALIGICMTVEVTALGPRKVTGTFCTYMRHPSPSPSCMAYNFLPPTSS